MSCETASSRGVFFMEMIGWLIDCLVGLLVGWLSKKPGQKLRKILSYPNCGASVRLHEY
jgi:hypothetical protein